MKIGALDSSLHQPLPITVKKFAQMGLQGIQINIKRESLGLSDAQIAEMKQLCSDNGLTISAVCATIQGIKFGFENEWQEAVSLFKTAIDITAKLGSHVLTTHIGVIPDDPADRVFEIKTKSLGICAEYAALHDIVIAIETGPEKAETLLKFLQAVDSKGLGVNMDPANLRMVTNVDPVHAVEILGKYIVHTHAKDGNNLFPGSAAAFYGVYTADGTPVKQPVESSKFEEVPLGQGQVPWDAYLAALKKCGFDGFLTIERECGPDPEGDIRLAYEFLKEKLGNAQ